MYYFVRSISEYCSGANLKTTEWQIRKNPKKGILGGEYTEYEETAIESCNLETLKERRLKCCLKFSRKCLKQPKTRKLVPFNSNYKGMKANEL